MTTLPQPHSRGHNDPKERAEETEDCHHSVRSSPSKPLHQTRGDGGEEKCSDSRATDTDTWRRSAHTGHSLVRPHLWPSWVSWWNTDPPPPRQARTSDQARYLDNTSQCISIHLNTSQCISIHLCRFKTKLLSLSTFETFSAHLQRLRNLWEGRRDWWSSWRGRWRWRTRWPQ